MTRIEQILLYLREHSGCNCGDNECYHQTDPMLNRLEREIRNLSVWREEFEMASSLANTFEDQLALAKRENDTLRRMVVELRHMVIYGYVEDEVMNESRSLVEAE